MGNKSLQFLFLCLLLASTSLTFDQRKLPEIKLGQRLDRDRVIYAINCGSKNSYKSKDGFTYEPDRHFHGNVQVATYYDHPKVASYGFKYTEDTELHRTERWANGPLQYALPLPATGNYVLMLKFSEVNFMAEGSRVFNILIGKTYIRKGFDILRGGHGAEVNLYIPISYDSDNDSVKWNGLNLTNPMNNKQMVLSFEAVADNPKINGIILYRGDLKDTDYYKLEDIRGKFDGNMKALAQTDAMRDQIMEEYMQKRRMKKK